MKSFKKKWNKIFILVLVASACNTSDNNEPKPPSNENDDQSAEQIGSPDDNKSKPDPKPLSESLQPTITDGKTWIYENISFDEGSNSIEKIVVVGDSVIEDLNCKLLDIYLNDVRAGRWLNKREENGKIYIYYPQNHDSGYDAHGWTETIDIMAQSATSYGPPYHLSTPVSREIIEVMGQLRRAVKVTVSRSLAERDDYWIEGFGSIVGAEPIYYQPKILPSHMHGRNYTRMLYCYDGEELIFDYTVFDPSTYKEEVVF